MDQREIDRDGSVGDRQRWEQSDRYTHAERK